MGRLGCGSGAFGLLLFLGGLFVLPRMVTFVGISLLVIALVLFWLEESSAKRASAASER
jgi:hypothetical protein